MFLLFLGKPAACLPCSELTKAHYHTHTHTGQDKRKKGGPDFARQPGGFCWIMLYAES